MIRLDLTALIEARRSLEGLAKSGWTVVADGALIQVGHEPASLNDLIANISPLSKAGTEISFVVTTAAGELVLRLADGQVEVERLPDVSAREFLDDREYQEAVDKLWSNDASQASELPLTWRARGMLALDRLVSCDQDVEVRVYQSAGDVIRLYSEANLAALQALLPAAGRRRAHVVLDGRGQLHTASLSFIGVESATVELPNPDDAEPSAAATEVPGVSALRPASSVHQPADWSWGALAADLEEAAAASAWCDLASDVTFSGTWALTFVGFKKLTVQLPPSHRLGPAGAESTLRLYNWVFTNPSPDKLLAIRRVASLYDGAELFDSSDDIRASAEVVFIGLRNDVVAEVLKASRDAQAQVLEVVRRTTQASQDAVKAITDRAMAALVGIGGVVIANSSKVIDAHVTRSLLLLVAAFLAMLALWSVFLEGPQLASPLNSVIEDIEAGTALVTTTDIDRLRNLASFRKARRQAVQVRIIVPSFYIIVALIVIVFGRPELYR